MQDDAAGCAHREIAQLRQDLVQLLKVRKRVDWRLSRPVLRFHLDIVCHPDLPILDTEAHQREESLANTDVSEILTGHLWSYTVSGGRSSIRSAPNWGASIRVSQTYTSPA